MKKLLSVIAISLSLTAQANGTDEEIKLLGSCRTIAHTGGLTVQYKMLREYEMKMNMSTKEKVSFMWANAFMSGYIRGMANSNKTSDKFVAKNMWVNNPYVKCTDIIDKILTEKY